MSFYHGFSDEIVKLATRDQAAAIIRPTDEPWGEYTTPALTGAAGGGIFGALTGKKGTRLKDALLLGLLGSGIGVGREAWRRRKAKKK